MTILFEYLLIEVMLQPMVADAIDVDEINVMPRSAVVLRLESLQTD